MIIDANVHITPNGKWFESNLDASLENLLNEMKSANITKSILVPFEGIINDEFILDVCKKHPDDFIPASSFNPAKYASVSEALNGFKEKYQENVSTTKIIKFHNRLHKYDIDDERFLSILNLNNQYNRPNIIYLCSLFLSKNTSIPIPPPVFIHQLSKKLANTTIVLMHSGGSWCLPIAEAIRDLSNVYMDLSYILPTYKLSSVWLDLKYLVTSFDKRLIWGSDFPEFSIQHALNDFSELTSHLPLHKKENILYNNIANILQE